MADEPDFAANPCCALWKDKFSKLQHKFLKTEKGRDALREGIKLYNQQITLMQAEIDNLKKAYDEEKQRVEYETNEKKKESLTRASLENDVSALKSEILSLRQKECSEVQCLNGELTRVNEELIRVKEELQVVRQCDGEAEMNQLNNQLQEARKQIISEKKKAEEEKKRANEARKIAEAEKSKTYEELRLLQARADSGEAEIDRLKAQIQEARLQADSDKKMAEAERNRADSATEIAEAEKSKAYEELRLLRARADSREAEINQLTAQIQEARLQADSDKKMAEEERKRADIAKEKAETEKCKAYEELRLLRARADSGETEINRLTALLDEARLQVDSYKREAEEEKKRASGSWEIAEAEKSRAFEELKVVRARADSGETEISRLTTQLQEARLQVNSDKRKAEEEKKRADDAWNHVEAEKNRAAEELTRLHAHISNLEVEMNLLRKNLQEDKFRAESEQKRKSDEAYENTKSDKGELELLKADNDIEKSKEPAGADNVNVELELLRVHVSEGERERKRLNELLDNEKMRADSEKKKAEAEKKKADREKKKAETEKKKAHEAWNIMKAEKIKFDEERRIADSEREKAEDNRLKLEKLKMEADETRSKLVSVTMEFEEASKKLEAERQLVIKDRKRADVEKDNAEQQRKLAEITMCRALEEKSRADRFSQQLEEDKLRLEHLRKEVEFLSSRQSIEVPVRESVEDMIIGDNATLKSGLQVSKVYAEESISEQAEGRPGEPKQKVKRGKKDFNLEINTTAEQTIAAEDYREKALAEKARADKLTQQLEEYKLLMEDLRKQRLVLVSPAKLDKPPVRINMGIETAKIKLLKQELKLEKQQTKHAKQVVKLEKSQRKSLQQELSRIKTEFQQFSHRLELCNCFTDCHVGNSHLTKNCYRNSKRKLLGSDACHMQLQSKNEHLKPSCAVIDDSVCFQQCIEYSAPVLPKSGIHTECTSGTTFKLQPLLRGSDRKNLHCSAIDSSLASFSDNQLVGSQGRCAYSISKSAEWAEEKSKSQFPNSRFSGEVNRIDYNTNIAVVAENNVRGPVDSCGRQDGHSKKRKQISDSLESGEYLLIDGKKCEPQTVGNACLLNNMLESQIGKPSQESSQELGDCEVNFSKTDCHKKKQRTIMEAEVSKEHIRNSNVQKDDLGRKPIEVDSICLRPSPPSKNVTETAQTGKREMCESLSRQHFDYFEEVLDGDYMKLLDLDNAADEERYCLAIQNPLSPTLPEIAIKDSATVERDDLNPSNGCLIEKLCNLNNSAVQSCNFETMTDNMLSSKSKFGGFHAVSTFEMSVNDENNKSTSIRDLSSGVNNAQDSSIKRGFSNVGHKGSLVLSNMEFVSTYDDSSQFCVVFSNISESSSLSKIFCTTRTLKNRYLELSQKNIAVKDLMSALVEVDNLLPMEKVCVFFTLLWDNCCWKIKDFVDGDFIHFLEISVGHMMKVMSDVETRRIVAELCILDEVVSLIEDFLIEQRVLVQSNGYAAPAVQSDQRVNITHGNGKTSLSFQTASPYQLLCGAIALASLCVVFDRIGFLCEASYNVARMRKLDSSVVTILHVFANVRGSEYFALSGYGLIMDVLKSLVIFRENESESAGFVSSHQIIPLEWPRFPRCTNCPFSKGAVSLNVLTSRLVNKLESCSGLHKSKLLRCQSKADFDSTWYDLGDIVSLLELVGSVMSWNWTRDNIVTQLLLMLEAHVLESALTACLVLLGQLAQIGIDANGSKDSTVEKIRGKFCALLSQSEPRKVGLPIQIVAVNSLLGTMSLSFEDIIEMNTEFPEVDKVLAPADCIRKWFSMLSNEQKHSVYKTFKC